MVHALNTLHLRIPRIILILQLLYVVVSLTLLLVLLHSLDLGSVSNLGTRLFAAIYIVVMILANVAWRLAITHWHTFMTAIVIAAALAVNIGIAQLFILQSAHSSFDNYYKFRGCTQLISRTTNSAICKLQSGELIKIVQFQNKWYLYGDLPNGWF